MQVHEFLHNLQPFAHEQDGVAPGHSQRCGEKDGNLGKQRAADLLRFGPDLGLSLEFLNRMPEISALGVIALLPLAGLACLGISFLISCRIVDRKEF